MSTLYAISSPRDAIRINTYVFMAILTPIKPEDVRLFQFQETSLFNFLTDEYKVVFGKATEVAISSYIREVNVFKNKSLLFSGMTIDPLYLELTSCNNRYLFIPSENSYEVFDLHSGSSIKSNMALFNRNQFDATGKYLLVVGYKEYQLIDLIAGQVVLNADNIPLSTSNMHFGSDNSIWSLNQDNSVHQIEKIDPSGLSMATEIIPSPFEFFNIDKNKYQKLIDLKRYCLWEGGGMRHSSSLNRWQLTKTREGIIYSTVIPISDIRYSNNYNVETCDVKDVYVTVEY